MKDPHSEFKPLQTVNGIPREILGNLNIPKRTSINVCRVGTKLKIPEISQFINNYDIVCIQKSKLDSFDNIYIEGFCSTMRTYGIKYNNKPGGTFIMVIHEIDGYVK